MPLPIYALALCTGAAPGQRRGEVVPSISALQVDVCAATAGLSDSYSL